MAATHGKMQRKRGRLHAQRGVGDATSLRQLKLRYAHRAWWANAGDSLEKYEGHF